MYVAYRNAAANNISFETVFKDATQNSSQLDQQGILEPLLGTPSAWYFVTAAFESGLKELLPIV